MAIQGLRDTSGFVTDQRPKNWREGIFLMNPNGMTSLTGLTSLMKSKVTDDPDFYWWDKYKDTRRVKLSAAALITDTALSVVSDSESTSMGAKILKQGDLLYNENTGEIVRVVADPTLDTSVTVSRAFAGSTAAAMSATVVTKSPYLVVIGSAYEEGSTAPTGVNRDPTKRVNYTQIFRNTLEMTRTAAKTRLRTGDAVVEAKRECLQYHGSDMERAFWFGKGQNTLTVNGKPARTTDGVINVIDSGNVKDASVDYSSGLTMTGLEEYMYNIFLFGSSEKMVFTGNRALLVLQQVMRKNSTWQFTSGIKEFGMNVLRVTSPFGELVFKTHPLFNEQRGSGTTTSSYYGMESWMWVLDMENISYRYLTDSDTKYQSDIGVDGLDGMKSGYLTECGLQTALPKTHYLIKNVVKAAVG